MRAQRVLYRVIWVTLRAVFNLLCRIETEGQANVPAKGPFIMASNHLHLFDPPLVVASVPYREITALTADKWAKVWPFNWLLMAMGAIFVRRGEVDRVALRRCLEVLENDGILGLAPEGTRSRTGTMQRGKPGIAYLAIKADVPVVPIGVSGQTEIFNAWKRLRRPHIVVRIGPAFKLAPVEGQGKGKQLQARSDEVMHRIAALVHENLRGVYTDSVREAGSTA